MAGAIPQTSAINQYRSLDGMVRMDMGNLSMISNPATGERILLNHLTMQAQILPPSAVLPGMPQMPGMAMPGMPQVPGAPQLAGAASIIQLGKSMIEGHAVQGVRYVFPQTGLTPPSLQSWEIWTSTKLNVPVMTQAIGSFGQQTRICKVSATPPSPTLFQIPPNYSVVQPPAAPAVPSMPNAPSMQSLPSVPSANLPAAPSLPNAPAMPSAPNLPSAPGIPSAPAMPSAPTIPNAPNLSMPGTPPAPRLPNTPGPAPPKFPGLK